MLETELLKHELAELQQLSDDELLLRFNRKPPEICLRRYPLLIEKPEDESLTEEEHAELTPMIEEMEWIGVERLKHLIALANKHGKSLREMMKHLGLKSLHIG